MSSSVSIRSSWLGDGDDNDDDGDGEGGANYNHAEHLEDMLPPCALGRELVQR